MSDQTLGRSTQALLALLQVNDSLFPSGTFTHSFGLETLVREGFLRDARGLECYLRSVVEQSALTADAVAARTAWRAADGGDVDAIVAADRALCATKAASELRAASLATGRRLVEETAAHLDVDLLRCYAACLHDDRSLGMQPVAFGVVCRALDVALDDVAPAMLQSAAVALLQAAMRLLPLSHRDVQATLHGLRPWIASLSEGLASLDGAPPRAFHPLQEIASMRHARSQARLFAS